MQSDHYNLTRDYWLPFGRADVAKRVLARFEKGLGNFGWVGRVAPLRVRLSAAAYRTS